MKKSYLMIAAAATILTACSSNEIKNDVKEFGQSAIVFSSYADKQTKAAENSNATDTWHLEDHSSTFNVWAAKYYNSAWMAVYSANNKGTVTYNTSSSAWEAAPIKFWDKSADRYIFYAAAPNDAKWKLENNSTDDNLSDDYLTFADFTLTGTNLSSSTVTAYQPSFKEKNEDKDLMIAENKTVERTFYKSATVPNVDLLFDHILSRLNITVKRGTNLKNAGATVKLTGFSITGVNLNNKGSFDESLATGSTLSQGTTTRWTASLNGTYNLTGACPAASIEDQSLYIGQYLIIPQSITRETLDRAKAKLASDGTTDPSHPYFKIDYTINDEAYTAFYNLADAFGAATVAFNEGWQNTLNITLDADAITFDAEVYVWAAGAGNNITIEE